MVLSFLLLSKLDYPGFYPISIFFFFLFPISICLERFSDPMCTTFISNLEYLGFSCYFFFFFASLTFNLSLLPINVLSLLPVSSYSFPMLWYLLSFSHSTCDLLAKFYDYPPLSFLSVLSIYMSITSRMKVTWKQRLLLILVSPVPRTHYNLTWKCKDLR